MGRAISISFPDELITEIDALVGSRGRSAFLEQAARGEVRRLKLLRFLESKDPAWRDEDHPEFCVGTVKWVRKAQAENKRSKGAKSRFTRSRR
jgi:hypothetical protein